MHTPHYWSKKIIVSVLLLAAWPTFAITTSIPSVSVIEEYNPVIGRGQFNVTNTSVAPVYAFAVGNNMARGAFGHGESTALLNLIDSSEQSNRWAAGVISRQSWETNEQRFGRFANQAWVVPDTRTLNWDDLFGTEFTKVVAYWVVGQDANLINGAGLNSTPIDSGSSQSHFFFYSDQAFSPFITFGVNGTVTERGDTTVVPIPTAFWLFSSALLGFVQFSHKKKA